MASRKVERNSTAEEREGLIVDAVAVDEDSGVGVEVRGVEYQQHQQHQHHQPLPSTYCVTFGPGTLGIDTQEVIPGKVYVLRDRLPQLASAGVPFASRSGGVLSVGDRVVKVGDVDVCGASNAAIRDTILGSPRPLTLTFERVPPSERVIATAVPTTGGHRVDSVVFVEQPVGMLPAPPGALPGGYYERERYCGPVSWLIGCFLFWPIVFCPVDSVIVYREPGSSRRFIMD